MLLSNPAQAGITVKMKILMVMVVMLLVGMSEHHLTMCIFDSISGRRDIGGWAFCCNCDCVLVCLVLKGKWLDLSSPKLELRGRPLPCIDLEVKG